MSKQTIKEFMLNHYDISEITDIARHGCQGGIGGFIYYHETTKFHDEHEDEIWDMLEELRESQGDESVLDLIANFNGRKNVGSMMELKNLLCWFAVETVAQDILAEADEENQ